MKAPGRPISPYYLHYAIPGIAVMVSFALVIPAFYFLVLWFLRKRLEVMSLSFPADVTSHRYAALKSLATRIQQRHNYLARGPATQAAMVLTPTSRVPLKRAAVDPLAECVVIENVPDMMYAA